MQLRASRAPLHVDGSLASLRLLTRHPPAPPRGVGLHHRAASTANLLTPANRLLKGCSMKSIVAVCAVCLGLFGAATRAAATPTESPRVTPAVSSGASPITAAPPPTSLSQRSRQGNTSNALQAAAGAIVVGSIGGWVTMRRRRPGNRRTSPAAASALSATQQVLVDAPRPVQAYSLDAFDDLVPRDTERLLATQSLAQAEPAVMPSRHKRLKARSAHVSRPRTRHHALTQWAE